MERSRRFRLLRGLLVVGVLLAVGAGVLLTMAGDSDPVSDQDALAAFKAAPAGAIPASGPDPGVYRYRATGTERGGAGPLTVSRDLPAQALLVVTSRPDGWEAELSYSRQHIEGARYVLRDGAIVVTWRRTKVTFAGFGRDDRRAAEPASVFVPAELVPGHTWTERYRTGDITVASVNRVLRRERLPVGGDPVDTFVIESRSTTTGAHPGTRTELMWWAPSLGLPVRLDVDMDIGGVFAFRARTRVELVGTAPLT